jgi:hypothetical protein
VVFQHLASRDGVNKADWIWKHIQRGGLAQRLLPAQATDMMENQAIDADPARLMIRW